MGRIEPGADETVRLIADGIATDFTGVDAGHIAEVTREEFAKLSATTKAPAFVGILSERRARDRLVREDQERSPGRRQAS